MRAALLAAALAILETEGSTALTVRNVTQAAGCTTMGVYTHFGGKQGLVDAIFVSGFDAFDAAVGPHLARGDVAKAGMAYRRFALDHTTQYMVMFGGAVPGHEPSPEARLRALDSFRALVAGAATAGLDDPEERAAQFFAVVHGHVMLEIVGMVPPGRLSPEQLFRRHIAAITSDAVRARSTR